MDETSMTLENKKSAPRWRDALCRDSIRFLCGFICFPLRFVSVILTDRFRFRCEFVVSYFIISTERLMNLSSASPRSILFAKRARSMS